MASDYAGLVEQILLKKKKFLFFKAYRNDFYGIYLDEKFWKKKKWPGHLGRWSIKFDGKGHRETVPTHVNFSLNETISDHNPCVDYLPSHDGAREFLGSFGGDFKILDSAKYSTKNGSICMDVYNIYDDKNKRYIIFVVGWSNKGGKTRQRDLVKLVQVDLRKWFIESQNL